MSNPLKAVGKVFKAVVKVVKKVAIPALMIGAVVLTGGAALGALPAIGSILGSIGITGTMASVLGGAISMGAIGAVTGGITGALTGKGFLKGATGGFLMGAATGGIMGGIGLLGANGVLGGMGQAAAGSATNIGAVQIPDAAGQMLAQTGGAGGGFLGSAATVGSAVPTTVATSATSAATAAGGGLLKSGLMGPLLQGAGSIISGFAQGSAAEANAKQEAQALQDKYDRTAFNYGYRNIYGDPKSNVPTGTEQVYQYAPTNFYTPWSQPSGLLQTQPSQYASTSTQYQIVNGQVVPVRAAA